MKVSAVIIVISAIISVALAVLMYTKRIEEAKIAKKASFMDVKVRVTYDVMGEYQIEAEKTQKTLDENLKELELLAVSVQTDQTEVKAKNIELKECVTDLKKAKEDTAASLKEMQTGADQLEKEKPGWSKEIADLKEQLNQKSPVCDFVKKDSVEGMKLCGNPIPEAPEKVSDQKASKVKAPKAEAPKKEAPKKEAPKAAAPKAK